jgi:hypothetical protein
LPPHSLCCGYGFIIRSGLVFFLPKEGLSTDLVLTTLWGVLGGIGYGWSTGHGTSGGAISLVISYNWRSIPISQVHDRDSYYTA